MNILQVHNRYIQTGGEWSVLSQERDLLAMKHKVDQYVVENKKALRGLGKKLRLVFSTHKNNKHRDAIDHRLTSGHYNLMHVHNFFPLLTPSVFEAARKHAIPSVLSLHNFRLIHPNGLLYHKGKIDERSVKGSAWKCVWDGVYRNSILQTAVVAHMIEYHRKQNTWQKFPSAFIALTEFSKSKFVEGGVPEERIFVKPNFIEDPLKQFPNLDVEQPKEEFYLYAGRISGEKGIEELLRYWIEQKRKEKLVVAGDGPLKSKLQKKSEKHPNVQWVGHIEKEQILELMISARAMIFPTKCYENFPITILEAMSVGCPVVASNIGNPAKIIDHGKTGFLFDLKNIEELTEQLQKLENREIAASVSRLARETYLKKYTPERNYTILMDIYERAAEFEQKIRP